MLVIQIVLSIKDVSVLYFLYYSSEREKKHRVGTVYTDEEVQVFNDLGLGRGVDATNPKPWINRSAFQVRFATPDNIVGTEEGNLYRSFLNEVDSSLNLQTSLSASIPANQLVSINIDAELSRNYSTNQKSEGAKVITRSIAFLSGFEANEDFSKESNSKYFCFERRLLKWMSNEMGCDFDEENNRLELILLLYRMHYGGKTLLTHICYKFIKTFSITHYVHSLELGASYYHVISDKAYETKVSQNTKVTAKQVASVSAGVEGAFGGKSSHKKYTRIGHMNYTPLDSEDFLKSDSSSSKFMSAIQSPTVGRNTMEEAVVGIKLQPISSLIGNQQLRNALQNALQDYIHNQQHVKCT